MKSFMVVLGLVLVAASAAWGVGGLDSFEDTRTKVTVAPEAPSSSDDISVTISRWVEAGQGVAGSTVSTQGGIVRLDLHWATKPGAVVYGIWPPPYHWETHTVSIGTFNPGRYRLVVNSDGRDMATASFTVADDASAGGSTSESIMDRLRNLFASFWNR
jgi:hypothetical protein